MSAGQREYDPIKHPLLARRAARPGMSTRTLARKLQVPSGVLRRWMVEHPELRAAIVEGELVVARVEEALVKRALGAVIEIEEASKDGEKLRAKKVRRQLPPDVAAQKFILINRCPGKWKAKPPEPRAKRTVVLMRPVRRKAKCHAPVDHQENVGSISAEQPAPKEVSG